MYQSYMHIKSIAELLSFDLEIERTLFKRKKAKADKVEMEDQNSGRFIEGHSDHNDMLGLRKPTLGDCWRPLMNEDYSGICHQLIDANNLELKPALINMVQQ